MTKLRFSMTETLGNRKHQQQSSALILVQKRTGVYMGGNISFSPVVLPFAFFVGVIDSAVPPVQKVGKAGVDVLPGRALPSLLGSDRPTEREARRPRVCSVCLVGRGGTGGRLPGSLSAAPASVFWIYQTGLYWTMGPIKASSKGDVAWGSGRTARRRHEMWKEATGARIEALSP